MMANRLWIICFLVQSCIVKMCVASAGDSDPNYRACTELCEKIGCVGDRCFSQCKFPLHVSSIHNRLHPKKPLYMQWKQLDCQSNCRYHCMWAKENEREVLGLEPVKYHGKWPFKRIYGFQEPASVVFSFLNLAMHIHGWVSFFVLLHYKLPMKSDKRPLYDYAGLWSIYGLMSMNAWLWSAVFHSWDMDLTEKLDYLSAVALLGYSLILAIIRCFSLRNNTTRVIVAAPLISFTTTHILYLNNYEMDYGWNMKVCIVMGATQLLIWSIWAGVTRHPSRWKLWIVVVGGGLAMLLEIFDFPPYLGLVDAHALLHASTVPLTYIWWNFVKDDAEHRTSKLLRKSK
ncbi:uncharacterized protein LOC127246441 isoform X2 [Andrographis paniculata]|uniref:uncharacterized protein LOC127246441 isoform X2 n=1 Tax=Andrographis paniculata TaxID=175694 RepID=UPI0021E6DAA6|nr:uncharacterized protein LOC127246441 isoform X2 [Andrographis paniculata]